MEAIYAENIDLVRSLAWKFCKRYGTDFDECFAEANLGFVKAYNTYNPAKGTLAKRISHQAWAHMLDALKRTIKAGREIPENIYGKPTFDLSSFLEGLSEDAKEVVRLSLEVPAEISENIQVEMPRPRNISAAVKTHLRLQKWTYRQIGGVWKEVAEALS